MKPIDVQPVRAVTARPAPLPRPARPTGLSVGWARHLDELREAQRLRHLVFGAGPGARRVTTLPGHDIDLFDDFCEHLLVREAPGGPVIGTCRVLTPAQARRVGSTCSDTAFDLTRLRAVRARLVEVGRGCVHPDQRPGAVAPALWGALGRFMADNGLDTLIGSARIPLAPDGREAARLWRQLSQRHLAPVDWQVRPRLPLPVERLDDQRHAEPPALLRACLRLGARVMGPPAWDPDTHSAELPLLLRLADLPARARQPMPNA